jgi:NAD(P)H-hydrate epimerase
MKTVTAREMGRLERKAETKYGIPTLLLMENAGRSVADFTQRLVRGKRRNFLILCGQGNNGGDGLVVARHLYRYGHRVQILFLGRRKKLKPDSLINYTIVRKMKIPFIKKVNLTRALQEADYVIDALIGTGLRQRVRESQAKVIETLNQIKPKVIAVDVPSGLDSDTGRVRGIAVQARWTLALGRLKRGMIKKIAKPYCGKIILADIGLM